MSANFEDPNSLLHNFTKAFTDRELPGDKKTFFTLDSTKMYFQGTTVQALVNEFRLHSSGLLVPLRLSYGAAPIDLYYKYIPWSCLFKEVVPLSLIVASIQLFNRDEIISSCAFLADMSHPSDSDQELNNLVADQFPELIERASPLLNAGDRFFGPQAPLLIAKLAILVGRKNPELPVMPDRSLISLCLAVQDHLYTEIETDADKKLDQAKELVANSWLHRRSVPVRDVERFSRRWLSEGETSEKIRASYLDATGIPVEHMANLAVHLFNQPRTFRSRFNHEGDLEKPLDIEISRALNLLSADASTFQKKMFSKIGSPAFNWDFSAFDQFPIYRRTDGALTIIDKSMLMRRCLGWSLVYDAEESMDERRKKSFEGEIEHLAERHVCEQFDSALGKSWKDRIVPEAVLLDVFGGDGIQTADLAIEYSNSWLVVEISASRPRYEALSARSVEDYQLMISQAVIEGRQALSTCMRLLKHADEGSFEFRPISPMTKMYPLVVLTEGFPISPFSLNDLRETLRKAGHGNDPRIAPLEVIDSSELELLLALTVKQGIAIVDLLEAKRPSNFWSDSVNNFVMKMYRDQVLKL